mmetsp:Transcript_81994/g.235552  ORF Transcript_81994/g.235552 Transcript_81994/m.235552 type:complete len:248 (+) Transcript_81994:178-921(+)
MLGLDQERPDHPVVHKVCTAFLERVSSGALGGLLRETRRRHLQVAHVLQYPGVSVLVEARASHHVQEVDLVVQGLLRGREGGEHAALEELLLVVPMLAQEGALGIRQELQVLAFQVVLWVLLELPQADSQVVPEHILDALQVLAPQHVAGVVGILVFILPVLVQVLTDVLHDLADVLDHPDVERQELRRILLVAPHAVELRQVRIHEIRFVLTRPGLIEETHCGGQGVHGDGGEGPFSPHESPRPLG